MKKANREHVLVIKHKNIPHTWLPDYGVVDISLTQLKEQMSQWPLLFLPRHEVENDSRYKQVIPYVIFFVSSGGILCYQRKGNEQRLHNLFSAGIGGHISKEQDSRSDFWQTFEAGLLREIKEESGITPGDIRFWGIINEHKTKVGLVHLGLVFSVFLKAEELKRLELSPELHLYDICSVDKFLQQGNYEYWSGLALQLIQQKEA